MTMVTSTQEYRAGREKLLDVREERRVAASFEFRENKSTGTVILEGYASTFDPYDVHGGPDAGGWVEQLGATAFDRTLSEQPDVQLLVNHEGLPLARTKSGNLKLSRDKHGLRVRAELDSSDPDVQRLIPKMRRGDMDEMSFAFRVKEQSWDSTYTQRTINELSLQKGDVSVVNYGMNPGTRAVLNDAIGTLAQLSSQDLIEVRNLDTAQVRRAQATLAKLHPTPTGPKAGKPASKAAFADPGYKDGRKRYPLDTEAKARGAWAYIGMPKNQRGYTAGQLSSIKDAIRGALKDYGVTVEAKAATVDRIDQRVNANGSTTLVAVMTDGTRVPLPAQRGDTTTEWAPSDTPTDPHDVPFDTGEGKPALGPVPENIGTGSVPFSTPAFHNPVPSTDPHDQTLEKESMDSCDPHDTPYSTGPSDTIGHSTPAHEEVEDDPHNTPYDLGSTVGNVPMDRPNYGEFPQGKIPENIVRSETEPWNWTDGALEPGDPAEDLDAQAERPAIGTKHELGYDPFTGEGRVAREEDSLSELGDDPLDEEDGADPAPVKLSLAEALNATIVHCYKLAEGQEDLRKLLATAGRQLNDLRGVKMPKDTDVNRKLAELAGEIGTPDTATVSGGLEFLRSTGSAPIGFRGGLNHDPDIHVLTAAERLARDKAEALRDATHDMSEADEKVRMARREAELNGAIRRQQARSSRTGRVGPFDDK